MRNCYLKTNKERKLITSQVVPFNQENGYLYFEYYGRLEDLDLSSELIITDELLETLNNEIPETPETPETDNIDYQETPQQDYTKYYLSRLPLTNMRYTKGWVERLPLTNMRYINGWVERRLETISNLYTAKVHIFKEWEETDQRVIDLLNEREQLRARHAELKLLIENETNTE